MDPAHTWKTAPGNHGLTQCLKIQYKYYIFYTTKINFAKFDLSR
jgi:hypothetical protein